MRTNVYGCICTYIYPYSWTDEDYVGFSWSSYGSFNENSHCRLQGFGTKKENCPLLRNCDSACHWSLQRTIYLCCCDSHPSAQFRCSVVATHRLLTDSSAWIVFKGSTAEDHGETKENEAYWFLLCRAEYSVSPCGFTGLLMALWWSPTAAVRLVKGISPALLLASHLSHPHVHTELRQRKKKQQH